MYKEVYIGTYESANNIICYWHLWYQNI